MDEVKMIYNKDRRLCETCINCFFKEIGVKEKIVYKPIDEENPFMEKVDRVIYRKRQHYLCKKTGEKVILYINNEMPQDSPDHWPVEKCSDYIPKIFAERCRYCKHSSDYTIKHKHMCKYINHKNAIVM